MSGVTKVSRERQTVARNEEAPIMLTEANVIHNTECILNSPVSRSTDHRTPIRKNKYKIDEEASPDEGGYRCSPTSLPCTQEVANEVAWDWHSPLHRSSNAIGVDRKGRNCMTPNNTSKRAQLLRKKRAAKSNSPLLHKPIKRKLIKPDNIENIGKFTAELRALADKIVKDNYACDTSIPSEIKETNYECDCRLIGDMDTQTFEVNEKLNENMTNSKLISTKNDSEEKIDSRFEDLFDDSINDCMMRCSQEVEDKLLKVMVGSGSTTLAATLSRNGGDKKSSLLQDDSTNDWIALCLEEDEDLLCKGLGDPKSDSNNVETYKHYETNKNKSAPKNNNRLREDSNLVPHTIDSVSVNHNHKMNHNYSSSVDKRKFGIESRSKVNSNTNSNHSFGIRTNDSRKIFKHKSLSDSNFSNLNSSNHGNLNFTKTTHLQTISKSSSNLNCTVNSTINVRTSSPNLKISPVRQITGSSLNIVQQPKSNVQTTKLTEKNNFISLDVNSSDIKKYMMMKKTHSDHENSRAKFISRTSREVNSCTGQTDKPVNTQSSRCTPAEIEKKRLDAKMKLEANMKKKQLSCFKPNGVTGLLINKPVKR